MTPSIIKPYCHKCGTVLDSEDKESEICDKCSAEAGHDYTIQPDVKFTRRGTPIKPKAVSAWEDTKLEETIWTSLEKRAEHLGVLDIANVVLKDPKFPLWSGSGTVGTHHYGTGQLAIHTKEVINLCFSNAQSLNLQINEIVVFLAGLFHDYGKCWDYQFDGYIEWNNWSKSSHSRLIHHVSRSNAEWIKAVAKFPQYEKYEESVSHAILAHHGRREWGSPVAPSSREAWLLHLCDNLSARMNDCTTNDILS
jgi:hypothetical protein